MNFRSPGTRRVRRAAIVDMTPLVDVIFQLLIFFVLTSSYVNQRSQEAARVQVELPESQLEAEGPQFDDVSVVIDEEGVISLEGEPLNSVEELLARLSLLAERNPNTIVLIRGDQRAPYGRVAEVMAAARVLRLKVSALLQGAP